MCATFYLNITYGSIKFKFSVPAIQIKADPIHAMNKN